MLSTPVLVKWMVSDLMKTNNKHLTPVIILSDKEFSKDTQEHTTENAHIKIT